LCQTGRVSTLVRMIGWGEPTTNKRSVCVCVWERERESMCVCVCVIDNERVNVRVCET